MHDDQWQTRIAELELALAETEQRMRDAIADMHAAQAEVVRLRRERDILCKEMAHQSGLSESYWALWLKETIAAQAAGEEE
jgi:hypothetical protein